MPMRSVKSDDLEDLRLNNEKLRVELAQLKKKLEYTEMGRDAYDCMIDFAEKQFIIPIRINQEPSSNIPITKSGETI